MAYSIRSMATALGVSKSQVARDKAAGMPMADADAARAWRLAQHDMSRTVEGRIDRPASAADTTTAATAGLATGAGGVSAPPASSGADELVDDEDTGKFRRARADREETNAETARLELEQLRGRLIDLDEAKRLAFTAFRSLRDAVLNVPARVKDQCAAEADALTIEQLLEAELISALSGFDAARVLVDTDTDNDDLD